MTRRISILLLLAAGLAGPAQAQSADDPLRIEIKPCAAGTVRTEVTQSDYHSLIQVSVGEESARLERLERENSQVTREVRTLLRQGFPGQLRVAYKKHEVKVLDTEEGKSRDKSTLAGKTFVVQAQPFSARSEEGNVVLSDDDRRELFLGAQPGSILGTFGGMVAGRDLVRGKEVPAVDGRALDQALGDLSPAGFEVGEYSIKLTGTRKISGVKCAKFAIKMRMESRAGNSLAGARIAMALKGEFCVGLENGWTYLIELKGPLVLESNAVDEGVDTSVSVKGKFKLKTTYKDK